MRKPQTYKFFREETEQWEDVELERWRWEVVYSDGTVLKQFDLETGLFHQFKEIDQSKLTLFRMVSDHHSHGYSIVFNPKTMKLIHFYRKGRIWIWTDEKGKRLVAQPKFLPEDHEGYGYYEYYKFYYFGYEKIINGKSYKFLMAIGKDDHLTATDDEKIKTEGLLR